MSYKILTWNINQAAGRKNPPPALVTKALTEQKAAVEILTEFCFCRNQEQSEKFLQETFTSRGYACYPQQATQNSLNGQNEVLIAWDTSCFEFIPHSEFSAVTTSENNIPNFVSVALKEKSSGNIIRIAGVRITMAMKITSDSQYQKQADLRREQMEYVYQKLDELTDDQTAVLIGGDFNNYRRETPLKHWNIRELTCGRTEYSACTPDGQSIYEKNQPDLGFQFAEDHFIIKNCQTENCRYSREFANLDKNREVYKHGEDFAYGKNPRTKRHAWKLWKYNHGGRYPDHAMLTGELELHTK